MTNKPFYKSKTVWGFGIALIVAGLQAMGLLDQTLVSELVKYIGGIFGLIGARQVLGLIGARQAIA